jgi:hypothetical protein
MGRKGTGSGTLRDEGQAVQTVLLVVVLFFWLKTNAQTADGNGGINQVNTLVRGYLPPRCSYAIGAIMVLVGRRGYRASLGYEGTFIACGQITPISSEFADGG